MPALGDIVTTTEIAPSIALADPERCGAVGSSTILGSATTMGNIATVDLTTERWKSVAGMHSTTTNPSRLIAVYGMGLWEITLHATAQGANTSAAQWWIDYPVTGVSWRTTAFMAAGTKGSATFAMDWPTTSAVTDYFEVRWAHNGGAADSATCTVDLSIRRVA